MTDCAHMNFKAQVNVNRMQKSELEPDSIDYYLVEARVECSECGQKLQWYGLPCGMSAYRPAASIDGMELRAPMVIPGERPPDGLPGYGVRHYDGTEGAETKQ